MEAGFHLGIKKKKSEIGNYPFNFLFHGGNWLPYKTLYKTHLVILMLSIFTIWTWVSWTVTDRQDAVSSPQLSAQVGWPACQDERHEDALSVLPAHNVESQTCGTLVQQDLPRFPAKQNDSVRDQDGLGSPQQQGEDERQTCMCNKKNI